MNPNYLCWAIVNWLEYELLCQRENLLSEASLKTPIAEFLNATQDHSLVTEQPYPSAMQPTRGRRRSIDFCLHRPSGNRAWTTILECKWANGRRDLSQEIFDDLLRLESVRKPDQTESFDRYFLIAGRREHLDATFSVTANTEAGGPRIPLIASVLPTNGEKNVPVYNSPVGIIEYWKSAAESIDQKELPLTINIELSAVVSIADRPFGCWLWRVTSVSRRSTRQLAETT